MRLARRPSATTWPTRTRCRGEERSAEDERRALWQRAKANEDAAIDANQALSLVARECHGREGS